MDSFDEKRAEKLLVLLLVSFIGWLALAVFQHEIERWIFDLLSN